MRRLFDISLLLTKGELFKMTLHLFTTVTHLILALEGKQG